MYRNVGNKPVQKRDPPEKLTSSPPKAGKSGERPRKRARIHTNKVYLGVGANVGKPRETIAAALALLDQESDVELVAVSTLRETDPVGYEEQPRFVNGVVELATELSPRELLARLLAIETRLGRVRGQGPRFGPRTIDLDLLLYGEETVDEPGLTLPHPRLHERRFVLEPLAELDPALEVPGRGTVQALLAGL
jgi:2-amino-4-hydroxy-6-hydroxymethyldihydropteridine diphosphokinase